MVREDKLTRKYFRSEEDALQAEGNINSHLKMKEGSRWCKPYMDENGNWFIFVDDRTKEHLGGVETSDKPYKTVDEYDFDGWADRLDFVSDLMSKPRNNSGSKEELRKFFLSNKRTVLHWIDKGGIGLEKAIGAQRSEYWKGKNKGKTRQNEAIERIKSLS